MEWIKAKHESNPKLFYFAIAGLSLASFFLLKRNFKPKKVSLTEYCKKLNQDIKMRLKNNPNIHFIMTKEEIYEDGGIKFVLKNLTSLKDKPTIKEQNFDVKLEKKDDPFMPPFEKGQAVAVDLTEEHRLLLNKYPVTTDHVLVITKDFVHQKTPLTYSDIEACLITMKAVKDGFIFFNWGKTSGASQPHKHMQWFPESNFSVTKCLPVSEAINKYAWKLFGDEKKSTKSSKTVDRSQPFMIPQFDFLHEIRFFKNDVKALLKEDQIEEATQDVFDTYSNMYKSLKLNEDISYNVLFTQAYLMMVPREKEKSEGISLNTLAFAGSFFNTNPERLDLVKKIGPLNMLKDVAMKKYDETS